MISDLHISVIEKRERAFFLIAAVIIAITAVSGFGLMAVVGISSIYSPWWVHLHALSFMSWIALYLTQIVLIYRNNIAPHRRLGWIGAGLAAWMICLGLVLTPVTIWVGRAPRVFTLPFFLALDWMNIVVFAALVFAAIRSYRNTDWHRRLMLCATICLIAPAWGRLLLLSGVGVTARNAVIPLIAYILAAMCADWRISGGVHRAYFWGVGAMVGFGLGIEVVASLPPITNLAHALSAH